MDNLKKDFGIAIKKRRAELGITQEKLAELSELHRNYIAEIERGKRNVSLENIYKIVHALSLTLSEFFTNYCIEKGEE